jgi:hypothetical protein
MKEKLEDILNSVGAIALGFVLGTLVVIAMAIVDLFFIPLR